MGEAISIYDFSKSSASYRVRIACHLKQLDVRTVAVDFGAEEQKSEDYRAKNPSGLVPFLKEGERFNLSQSLAILNYLDTVNATPKLFPDDPKACAKVWEMSLIVACDIHPLNNLRVLKHLKDELKLSPDAINTWYTKWIYAGFEGIEKRLEHNGDAYCCGGYITAADLCLVPQVFNAKRFNVDLTPFPKILEVNDRLLQIEAFSATAPVL